MRCAACGYIYDPNKAPSDIAYSQDFYAQVGGIPFIETELTDTYACPVCGTLQYDLTGLGLEAPAPQASAAAPAGPARPIAPTRPAGR